MARPAIALALFLVPVGGLVMSGLASRRSVLVGAAACGTGIARPGASWAKGSPASAREGQAELENPFDSAGILQRAREGKLNVEYVLERARAGRMFSPGDRGFALTVYCPDYEKIEAVDGLALVQVNTEIRNLNTLMLQYREQSDKFKATAGELEAKKILSNAIGEQIERLQEVAKNAGCKNKA